MKPLLKWETEEDVSLPAVENPLATSEINEELQATVSVKTLVKPDMSDVPPASIALEKLLAKAERKEKVQAVTFE